jgi:hypothetical protein
MTMFHNYRAINKEIGLSHHAQGVMLVKGQRNTGLVVFGDFTHL